jgi:hypothetical protein
MSCNLGQKNDPRNFTKPHPKAGRLNRVDESLFQCCFCGNSIQRLDHDPVSLLIPLKEECQQFWAHEICLREHLHESVPLALDDES